MTIRSIITGAMFAAGLLFAASAGALTVNSQPGSLQSLVERPATVTDLVVTGGVDASDLQFINENMTSLQRLDLSGASIAAYKGDILASGSGAASPAQIPSYAFFGSGLSTILLPADVTAIGSAAFSGSSITSISIPVSVTSIGSSAFAGCSKLQSIVVPSHVEELGDYLFKDCTALVSAKIEAAVSDIPVATFSGCRALADVTLPATVTAIGDNAFLNCRSLSELSFPRDLTSIGQKAFYGSGLREVNLSQAGALKTVGDYAFALNSSLKSVALPASVVDLGTGLFFDDAALTTITLPSALTSIPTLTFKGAASLDNPQLLPAAITNIGDYALMGMTSASSLVMPASLASIGDGAMEDWQSLKSIDAKKLSAVPQTGDDVWAGVDTSKAILYVNQDSEALFKGADQWKTFTIKTSSTSVDGVMADETAASSVEFRFVGDRLVIASAGSPIAAIDIYDLAGRHCLSRRAPSPMPEVDIELSRLPASTVVIINATLADSTVAPIKLAL